MKDDISKDIKKIIGIMQLGLKVGDEVIVNIKGDSKSKESKAKKNIFNFFETNF